MDARQRRSAAWVDDCVEAYLDVFNREPTAEEMLIWRAVTQ